jgi:Uma2 family endonuclease
VIEVADSSLNYDRTVKFAIYANSGIPIYLIINLKDRAIEVYSESQMNDGRYARVETLVTAQLVRFPAVGGAEVSVTARHLLP